MRRALSLASCVSGNPTWTARHSYPEDCGYAGMVRGKPPVWHYEGGFADFVEAVNRNYHTRGSGPTSAKANLVVLNLLLERKMKYGR